MTAAFRCTFVDFRKTTASDKLGALTAAAGRSGFVTLHLTQIPAWEVELEIFDSCISTLRETIERAMSWELLLEYSIPRRDKRPDAIVLADDLIFVIEFKIGAIAFTGADQWQALSYALDLRDFHARSAGRTIVPILLTTGEAADEIGSLSTGVPHGTVLPVRRLKSCDGVSLAAELKSTYLAHHNSAAAPIDGAAWDASPYRPTPNIIEAAEELFAGHSVAEISHSFATNLHETSQTLLRAIASAQSDHRRTICFVTGIPGAGKTLAGLNTVHNPAMRRDDRPAAVFLSGNGPLVKIVREAITRNRVKSGVDRRSAQHAVSAFIANVHSFLKSYGIQNTTEPPHEHAIVFDEAQRAWDAQAVFKAHEVAKSESALLLAIMQRAPDWCVVIALVGGGQEINTGEGGLAEWGRALNASTVPWQVLASGEVMRGGASVAGHRLFDGDIGSHLEVIEEPCLHLNVGVRSPRARWLGKWVNELLLESTAHDDAHIAVESTEFPVAVTRSLDQAKAWLRSRTEGDQRCGLLASSGALRLRAHGIEVSSDFRRGYSYPDWFLAPPDDCRSSNWLEVAATEFDCQGLELDWTAVCWGGDLVLDSASHWRPRKFRGSKWQWINKPIDREFVLNKYRVLLTRARRGMVVWVPRGDANDPTRDLEQMDAIAELLVRQGLPMISE